jgi:adenylate dimethylallyltransferase (cytokinin synthase)
MLHVPLNQISLPRIYIPRPLPDSSIYAPSFPMGSLRAKAGTNNKVVVVMGATGTGKSKLAIDLARRLGGEVVNSDKMQVYDGLDVVTNKVTKEECTGVPHHLINGVHPDADFTASQFRELATRAVDSISDRGLLPIIAGGSNSYIEELVDGANGQFRSRYKCCFLWVDVQLSVLHGFVSDRVDRMVERGLVEEVRALFDPNADCSKGLRRAIGVPELDAYLRTEGILDESERAKLLANAIDEIKANTCKLTCCQLGKIRRLASLPGWSVHCIKATEVFRERSEAAEKAWDSLVAEPGVHIVRRFLLGEKEMRRCEEVRSNFVKVMGMAGAGKVPLPSPRQSLSVVGATN